MQCPDCGYEVEDTAVFCPQCRFQFRDTDDRPVVPGTTIPDTTVHYGKIDESIFEQTPNAFSDKELTQLKVQLLAPTVLVVLIISLFTYTVISTIPFTPIIIAGLNFGVTGIVCLACGLVAGMVFYVITRRGLKKFRYR
jgi:hypothetical protein